MTVLIVVYAMNASIARKRKRYTQMERTMIESNDKFQRMVKLANADGVAIKARVTDKKTGDLLGFIVKGKANSEYHVEVKDSTLVCNCRAGELGNYCKHRAYCTNSEMERAAAENAASLITCEHCGNQYNKSFNWICPDPECWSKSLALATEAAAKVRANPGPCATCGQDRGGASNIYEARCHVCKRHLCDDCAAAAKGVALRDLTCGECARASAFPMRRDTGPRLYRDEAPRQAVALEERATEW